MIDISKIFNLFANATAFIVLIFVIMHIVSRLLFKKTPVKLDKNSLVVLTGACMGIGKQMALQIARTYHCRILAIDIRSELFDELSEQIGLLGGSCEMKKTDLSDRSSVKELLKYLIDRNEKIDLFIYNAGILCAKKTWQISEREHEMVMNVNYFTPTIMIKDLEHLLSHVCVVGSMTSLMPGGTNVSIYSSSKHAIVSYMSSLRQEYKKDKKNITVSIGCPYAINTNMLKGFKTRLDFLFRILDKKYVGKRLVKQFTQRKEICYIYEYEAFLFRLIAFLPTNLLDFCAVKFDISQLTSASMLEQENKKTQ